MKNQNPKTDPKKKSDQEVPKRDLDLTFNEKENSYELDVKSDVKEYVHPDPYDTAADNGADMNSDYDEANPYVGSEYDKNASLEHDADKLAMHVIEENDLKPSKQDEEFGHTAEDDLDDLDEEGYPKFFK
jgi:hypothetical protein